jgi:hypothetical protein
MPHSNYKLIVYSYRYTHMTFFIIQYVLGNDGEPSGIIMFDNIVDRLHRIIDILELDHSMTSIYHNGKLLDLNMSIRDSTLQTKDIIHVIDGYRDLDNQLDMLLELKKQSDIYREVKLYMLLLISNCNAVLDHSSSGSYDPIRLKKDISITPQYRSLIERACNSITSFDQYDNPLVAYHKELVRFLGSCTESYIQLRLDKLTTSFELSMPVLKSDSLRTLLIEAKYKLSLVHTKASIMGDETAIDNTHLNMNTHSHIGYLYALQRLIKIVHKNRINGLRPIIGATYHDIIYEPCDLSEFIDDDPYYLTCL